MVMLLLNRLLSRAKFSSRTPCLCGTHFENHCSGGASRLLAALATIVLASLSFLPFWTSLKVEKVAPVQMRKMGPEGDMILHWLWNPTFWGPFGLLTSGDCSQWLLSPQASSPGPALASTSTLFIALHWTVISVNSCYHCWAHSLCLRSIMRGVTWRSSHF